MKVLDILPFLIILLGLARSQDLGDSPATSSNSFVNLFRGIFRFGNDRSVPEEQPLGSGICLIGPNYTPIPLSTNRSCPDHFYCP